MPRPAGLSSTAPLLALAFALAACAPPPPAAAPLGMVRAGGASYPILPLDPAGTRWKVIVDRHRLICPEPTETACYWAVRHHLAQIEALDELAGPG